MLNAHEALIYTMVIVSAADREMTDREMMMIGSIVKQLPVFSGFSHERLTAVAAECAKMLSGKNKISQILQKISQAVPSNLYETVYTIACDVAAADGKVTEEEARILDLVRNELKIDMLVAAAIERAARARYMQLAARH